MLATTTLSIFDDIVVVSGNELLPSPRKYKVLHQSEHSAANEHSRGVI
jgi:hypothetical protein